MPKISKIIRREYLEAVRKKTFLLGTMAVPILMIGMIFISVYFAEKGPEKSLRVGLVDKTRELGSRLPAAMDDTLANGGRRFWFEGVGMAGRTDEEIRDRLLQRLESEELDAALVIPEDVLEGGSAEFLAKSVGVLGLDRRFRNALNQVAVEKRLFREGLQPDQMRLLMRDVRFKTLLIEKGQQKERAFEQEYAITMTAVMILYFSIMIHGLSIMRSVLEEKSSRVIEIILSSVTSLQLMVGKILGTALVSLTQYAIWGCAALVLMLIGMGGGAPAIDFGQVMTLGEAFFMVVFFLLGFLLFGTAYAAIGAMCNTEQEAGQLQTPLVMLLLTPIVIAIKVIQDPNGLLARVLSFVPFSAPILMFMRISVSSPSPWEIALSILGILISICVMFWIVARIFRVGVLMYGKRPNLPELIRWIRYA
jgi:ABC-2 type transport system permease protein